MQTLAELWSLVDHLMFKYADGYINEVTPEALTVTTEPYPDWWLKDVGFDGRRCAARPAAAGA